MDARIFLLAGAVATAGLAAGGAGCDNAGGRTDAGVDGGAEAACAHVGTVRVGWWTDCDGGVYGGCGDFQDREVVVNAATPGDLQIETADTHDAVDLNFGGPYAQLVAPPVGSHLRLTTHRQHFPKWRGDPMSLREMDGTLLVGDDVLDVTLSGPDACLAEAQPDCGIWHYPLADVVLDEPDLPNGPVHLHLVDSQSTTVAATGAVYHVSLGPAFVWSNPTSCTDLPPEYAEDEVVRVPNAP